MTSEAEKIRKFKAATKKLKAAQEDLRLARAEYNKAVLDIVDGDKD